jgi:predicted nucleotidyltransferase component of viral defense system
MIKVEAIKNFFPEQVHDNAVFNKYMVKEYIQLMILDHLSATPFIRKIAFIGGTSIRLIKGIDRFSEDLDFDCKEFSENEFMDMTNGILRFLNRSGLHAIAKDKNNERLEAFRRNIHFPELLFDLGLSGHREERFLIKVESQDQLVNYKPEMINIKGCGFFFPMSVPPSGILCAMKVSAMLNRQKGRDFYDAMFLLSQVKPDYNFMAIRTGIADLEALKQAAINVIAKTDMKRKMRDFEHLLFNKNNSSRILHAGDFFREL